MSGHTPGPWQIGRYGEVLTADGETLFVSGVAMPCGNHPRAAEAAANARLIAAAPELLEAAKFAERVLRDLHSDGIEYDFAFITEAIAKASGGQP